MGAFAGVNKNERVKEGVCLFVSYIWQECVRECGSVGLIIVWVKITVDIQS